MDAIKCLNLLREIKSVSFATVDADGNPQVRIIDVMNVEDGKLFFLTARGKDFHKELLATKRVAIVGLTKNYQSIRLNAQIKLAENQNEELDKIFKLNPVMENVYPDNSRFILDVFYIDNGDLEYFDLSSEPIFRQYYGEKPYKKGFEITDSCIKCGTCIKNCPQKAINELDTKMNIQNQHCLHCGLCYENCPVTAIKSLSE